MMDDECFHVRANSSHDAIMGAYEQWICHNLYDQDDFREWAHLNVVSAVEAIIKRDLVSGRGYHPEGSGAT
jgi:hypothetical protein